jgi:hypothetical protein
MKNAEIYRKALVEREAELAALRRSYNQLAATLEELLVEKFAISELRDFWRKRAGMPVKGGEE